VLYVKEILTERFGEQVVDSGGLRVLTTLDWEKQKIAEEAVSSTKNIFAEAGANNASLVAMDPKSGQILAMVGSRDFFDESIDGQFNVATQGLRQPGSSFKPIVYALAFDKGYTPDTLLFDVLTNFTVPGSGQKDYKPVNYDGKEHGVVTARTALQGSLNIPAVQMLYLAGPNNAIKIAERLGYTTLSEGDYGLSLVLGGGEVKLLEHTAAYGVFATGGVRHAATPILRVEDTKGEVLYEWKKGSGARVFPEETVATLSNVLSDDAARAFVFGAASTLTLPDRPVAAKTGTTNNYVDAWTWGYTPSLVAGVWAGNTDNTPLKPGFGGGRVAGTILNRFM
jgi:membrane peptidoglycan carboxypeptidase